MPPAIPDRWTAYKACGLVIEGTKLICFKVPLRKSVQARIGDISEIWDIPTLLTTIPNIGAVIDLTNTTRYYTPTDITEVGLLHKKVMMPGRILPPENKVIEFMDAVDEFLGRIGDKLIGVHCTHGLNRTGYMVCRYMRDRMNIPAEDAIKRFEKARGYKIERENYIAAILGRHPPPPHFGPHTSIKPVIDEDGENVASSSPQVSKRKHREQRNDLRLRNNSDSEYLSWRQRNNSDSHEASFDSFNRSSRSRKDTMDSNRSYDYRFDY